jgi:hypothetical protein
MTIAKIIRLEQSSQGALGSMILDDQLFCSTLEPDDQDKVKAQIPPGKYSCRRFHGTKWPDTYEILVPGHSAVLFHAGNTEADSMMCVLLGQYPGKLRDQRAVLNSGATFKAFMDYMRGKYPDAFDLEIINLIG